MRLSLCLALGLVLGCGDDAGGQASPDGSADAGDVTPRETGRDLWRSSRPDRYVVKVCGTGSAAGCTVVAVQGETVVSAARRAQGDDHWVTAADVAGLVSPVDEMFEQVDDAGNCLEHVAYNPTYGFVDGYTNSCAPRTDLSVTCFVADSDNLKACDPFAVCSEECALIPCDLDHPCAQPDAAEGAPAAFVHCFILASQGGGSYCMKEQTACKIECGTTECGVLTSDPASLECL